MKSIAIAFFSSPLVPRVYSQGHSPGHKLMNLSKVKHLHNIPPRAKERGSIEHVWALGWSLKGCHKWVSLYWQFSWVHFFFFLLHWVVRSYPIFSAWLLWLSLSIPASGGLAFQSIFLSQGEEWVRRYKETDSCFPGCFRTQLQVLPRNKAHGQGRLDPCSRTSFTG